MTPTPHNSSPLEVVTAWFIATFTSAVSGMPPFAVAVQVTVLGWTLHRWWNERKRTRILERAELAQNNAHAYGGPWRRATDPVNAADTKPGAMA